MKWGSGNEDAIARMNTITRAEMEQAGVTPDMAGAWRDFYVNEAARNPTNPSAAGRAQLMDYVNQLLTGGH